MQNGERVAARGVCSGVGCVDGPCFLGSGRAADRRNIARDLCLCFPSLINDIVVFGNSLVMYKPGEGSVYWEWG